VSFCVAKSEAVLKNRDNDFRKQYWRRTVYRWGGGVKSRHKKRFRDISAGAMTNLREMLISEIVRTGDEVDLHEHLTGRLGDDRYSVVPWIDAAYPLAGANVLEIGSGTGVSAIALGEQGAHITGIDVDPASLKVAQARCQAYNITADFHCINAADVRDAFPNKTFDIVVFFAVLEHMTFDERIKAIRSTWEMTRAGGLWCVVETPNRLWFYDGHTSFENFYHWLPDSLAKRWGTRSRRKIFSSALSADSEISDTKFARWGRGASFHEFDLALGEARNLEIVSNKTDFMRRRNLFLSAYSFVSRARKFERFLEALEPEINPGFFRQYLDLAIRKM
jgi:2-polyprenyl-3-methyl-5-hydroxy-6-metoxy-1,4-benzoquinol methylase